VALRFPRSIPVTPDLVAFYTAYLHERDAVPEAAGCDMMLSGRPDNAYCPEPGVIWTLRPKCASDQPLFADEIGIIFWMYRIVIN
jgi:hypothetical protein